MFRDSMHHAAQKLNGLEELTLDIKVGSLRGMSKLRLARVMEAWTGRQLKVGKVTITPIQSGKPTSPELEKFAENLSVRLMAAGA